MNQRKAGSIISYIQMILTMVVSFVYTPYMLSILGKNEYGLYNTVASTISMLSILSLGFSSGYIRYYSIYKLKNDRVAICKLNGLFIEIFSVIGFVGLVCGLFLAFHLDLVFNDGLTPEEYDLARVLMTLLTINLAISFPMSVFSSIICAHEKFVVLKLVGILKTVCGPLVTIPLLFMGYRSVAVVVITMVFSLIADVIYLYYVLHILKERFIWSNHEKRILRDLTVYTSFIAINMIIDQINWNIDKLVLARFKGTAIVAIYTVGYTLNSYYNMVSTAISGVFTPMVHGLVNSLRGNLSQQKSELTKLLTKVGRIQILILGLFSTGLVLFGKQFILYWAGEGYDDAYYVVLILAIPATIPLVQNVGIEIQRAMNKHRFRSIAYLCMAILNLAVSIALCQIWGAIGCAIGTGVSMIIANGLIMNIYYHKHCNVDIIFFWKQVLRVMPGILLPFSIFFSIHYFNDLSKSRVMLIAEILCYTLIYCASIWTFSMNLYEKSLIKRVFQKKRQMNDVR